MRHVCSAAAHSTSRMTAFVFLQSLVPTMVFLEKGIWFFLLCKAAAVASCTTKYTFGTYSNVNQIQFTPHNRQRVAASDNNLGKHNSQDLTSTSIIDGLMRAMCKYFFLSDILETITEEKIISHKQEEYRKNPTVSVW